MTDTMDQQSNSVLPGLAWVDRGLGWIKRRERAVVIVGVGFQVVVLLAMIATPLQTLVAGDTILLRVVPVDPRDLFRGDYVILNYEFSRVPPQGIPGLQSTDGRGQTVYVTLVPEEDGKHWRADRFSLRPPTSGRFLRGQMTRSHRIEYGIESYFVQEGEGLSYERAVRSQKLSAEVALDRTGKAVLKRLVIN
ncbi:GDYXXLXY domain-containing protein [Planctomycetes bacterium TBK1r]|uniref:GDYXXLXY domain-containing protein n=1 Tax=Stieleria magnilauensis TaxID=2527963 RepID=A0ABX5Y1M1_9BACT|nr:hypothetical protein TBK1r_71760 [Planctomycetes bacterium TBK1r]